MGDMEPRTNEQLFIDDLVKALFAQVKTAQANLIKSQDRTEKAFDAGILQGYWQVLSSLIARMKLHELDLDQYHIAGFDPDEVWTPVREIFGADTTSSQDEDTPP